MHQTVENIALLRNEALCYSLRRAELFAHLSEIHLRDLAASAVIRNVAKDAYLFHKDEVAPGLCLVRRGIINFHRITTDGREVVIHYYREGEIFAEFAAGSEGRCPADARALLASEVIVIPRRVFLGKLRQCPDLALRLLSALDVPFYRMADSLEGHAARNTTARFVEWLLNQCQDAMACLPVEIPLTMTKRALAGEFGVRQETFSRLLRKLSDAGHLRVGDRTITITNPRSLQDTWQNLSTAR